MRKLMTIIAASTLFCGLAVRTVWSYRQNNPEPARNFTITYLDYTADAKGEITYRLLTVREENADGTWKEKKHGIGGSNTGEAELNSDGLFLRNTGTGKSLSLGDKRFSDEHRQKARTAEFFETSPAFVGTDVVAGLQAYKLRRYGTKKDPEAVQWMEYSCSPKIGLTPLRIIFRLNNGTLRVTEAVKVEFKTQ